MRVSLAWLTEMCPADLSASALAELLTRAGLEVDALLPVAAPGEKVVAARITSVAALPKSNLKSLAIDAGDEGRFTVVSGAPNTCVGQMGALALPGATLPDGRVIEAREYHGVRSEAMLCSAAELALGDASDSLLELPAGVNPGQKISDLYGLPDICLDIDLTPNRGDCLSMVGVAREVHALTHAKLTPPAVAESSVTGPDELGLDVQEPEACPCYLGRIIDHLDLSCRAAPLWMRERLRRSGIRSGHPVVDVLNYVMLEFGQPMHAFDRSVLYGDVVTARYAQPAERIELLTGDVVALDPATLVIADQHGPVSVAGIMGGRVSAVTQGTESVFLESAHFNPAAIRGKARRLGLNSEAAQRFERGVDPQLAQLALDRASELILEIMGGRAGPVVRFEQSELLKTRDEIDFDLNEVTRLTGLTLPQEKVTGILGRLGFTVSPLEPNGRVRVTPPSSRFDIERPADLVEEVVRIHGYDSIASEVPRRMLEALHSPNDNESLVRSFCEFLRSQQMHEVIHMSFSDPQLEAEFLSQSDAPLLLENAMSEREAALRQTLWVGLLRAAQRNVARQQSRVRLFEVGPIFGQRTGQRRVLGAVIVGPVDPEGWGFPERQVDFFDIKELADTLLAMAGIERPNWSESTNPGLAVGRRACVLGKDRRVLVELGIVAPRLASYWDVPNDTALMQIDLDELPLKQPTSVQAIPRFPSVRRDLSLIVPDSVCAKKLLEVVHRFGGDRLVDAFIFDTYTATGVPSNAHSVGVGLVFQDYARTLIDADVDAAVSALLTGLEQEIGVKLRG